MRYCSTTIKAAERRGLRVTKRGVWLFGLLGLAASLLPSSLCAAIANICYPNPVGVPGMGSQAPHWTPGGGTPTRTDLDDPRWNGSMRFSFEQQPEAVAGGPDVSEATVRGLIKNNVLYVSYQVLVDPGGPAPGMDAIYFGIGPRSISADNLAYMIRIALDTTSTSVVAGTGMVTTKWYARASDSSTLWTPLGPTAPSGAINNIAIWTTADTWAINFEMDLSAVPVAPPLKTFYGINTQFTFLTFAQHSLPAVAGVFSVDGSNAPQPGLSPILPADWLDTWLGNASMANCPEGISISSFQIGSTNANPSTIVKGSNNTFFANPTYTSNYSALPSGRIKARFRLANWGSQVGEADASWEEIAAGENAAAVDGGGIQGTCYATQADADAHSGKVCPNPDSDGIITHQCMLVELLGTGSSSVNFNRSSAYRNMDFVTSSEFMRNAEISIDGLKPLRGKKGRDVYVYIRTLNISKPVRHPIVLKLQEMAVEAEKVHRAPRIDVGFLAREDLLLKKLTQRKKHSDVRALKKERLLPVIERMVAGQASFASDKLHTHYEKVTKVWPTYEVHVYHETGDKVTIGGKTMTRVRPQQPFGYHVVHDAPFYGWEYGLNGLDGKVVESLGKNFYRTYIPDRGALRLKTYIHSIEKRDLVKPAPEPEKNPRKLPAPGGKTPTVIDRSSKK